MNDLIRMRVDCDSRSKAVQKLMKIKSRMQIRAPRGF